MKKSLVMVIMVLFVAGLCVPSFAAKSGKEKKFNRIVAEVVSIDPAAKTMVVKREENGETKTVTISEKAAAQVHVGDRVRIKLKIGTNESAGVRVLGAKPGVQETGAESETSPLVNAESKPEIK